MGVLRTPDERFADLPGFPYQPRYVEVDGSRVHYIDEGSGEVVLCLHGEPSWSFVYRKMVPILTAENRVVAMDFIGFGRSDKFARRDDYSFEMHKRTLMRFVEELDLKGVTLLVQPSPMPAISCRRTRARRSPGTCWSL